MRSAGLPFRIKMLLTLAVFLSSGCIFFSQPLLVRLADTFGIPAWQAGNVTTFTLVGFVSGLLFVAPLADVVEKKRLIMALLWIDSALFAGLALSQNFTVFVALSFCLGLTAMVSQIIIPFVARLSAPHERGRNLGTVLSGAMTGVLAARAASGVVGEHVGWRAVFALAALVMLGLSGLLWRVLPSDPPAQRLPYRALLQSVWGLFAGLPELRRISFTGALMYASLTGFWATLAFQLSGPPFHLGPQAIGMFGFIGAAGATAASLVGPWADRLSSHTIVRACIGVMIVAYGVLAVGGASIAGLVLGVVVLDLAAQAATVSNQTAIYRLSDAATQSRLNTVYKILYNIGAATGAFTAVAAWKYGGWLGVCANGLGMLMLAGLVEWAPWRALRRVSNKPVSQARLA